MIQLNLKLKRWESMNKKYLISDPDTRLVSDIKRQFEKDGIVIEVAHDGKQAQLMTYNNQYDAFLLDMETKNHTALEVLKYCTVNKPGLKIILSAKSKDYFVSFGLKDSDLKKAGIDDVLYKPYQLNDLKKIFEGKEKSTWKNIKEKSSTSNNNIIVEINDEELTKIPINDFVSGKIVIFDCFVKMNNKKYTKIFNQGENFNQEKFSSFKNETIKHLYFFKKDRAQFISFMNDLTEKIIDSEKIDIGTKVKATKNLTEKYLEEVYIQNISKNTVDEGIAIISKIEKLIAKNKDLSYFMDQYEEFNPEDFGHLFLVTFFSTIIAQNLEWGSPSTTEKIAFGSMLHDIGKLKLPLEIAEMDALKMSDKQFNLYKQHPRLGAEILYNSRGVPEPVRQIVFQHHELVNGSGFPNGLSGIKIYPLAKIVSLADYFANLLKREKCKPLEALRIFIPDKYEIVKFDAEIIKSLISGFIIKKDKAREKKV